MAVLPYIYAELRSMPGRFRSQLLIDSVVGPSPAGFATQRSHSRAWLDSALVVLRADAVGALVRRRVSDPLAYIVSIGEPYGIFGDRLAVRYIVRVATVYSDPATTCGRTIELQLEHTRTGYRKATQRQVFEGCSPNPTVLWPSAIWMGGYYF
jgi:hypothetical protein